MKVDTYQNTRTALYSVMVDTQSEVGKLMRILQERGKAMKVKEKCCGCGKIVEKEVPPGPPEPSPFSCGAEECEKERIRRVRRIVG